MFDWEDWDSRFRNDSERDACMTRTLNKFDEELDLIEWKLTHKPKQERNFFHTSNELENLYFRLRARRMMESLHIDELDPEDRLLLCRRLRRIAREFSSNDIVGSIATHAETKINKNEKEKELWYIEISDPDEEETTWDRWLRTVAETIWTEKDRKFWQDIKLDLSESELWVCELCASNHGLIKYWVAVGVFYVIGFYLSSIGWNAKKNPFAEPEPETDYALQNWMAENWRKDKLEKIEQELIRQAIRDAADNERKRSRFLRYVSERQRLKKKPLGQQYDNDNEQSDEQPQYYESFLYVDYLDGHMG